MKLLLCMILILIVLVIFLITQYNIKKIIEKNNCKIIINNKQKFIEPFIYVDNIPISDDISFKSIENNKLYYGLECNYIKDDCFYETLKKQGFTLTTDIKKASLIVPCSYETTEKEIIEIYYQGIKDNIYRDKIRIFMLNNTDLMVSKLALWKFLKKYYGEKIASTMIPYSWDLTDNNEIEIFKNKYDSNKLYITKNNNQRQEGLQIHTNLQSILDSKDKYILVQELLQDPYLINNRKINLRVYVLAIRDNYYNIKLQIYRDGFMYYTPELWEINNPSFKKNITTGYIDRQVYNENPLTHIDFRKYLDSDRELTEIEKYYKINYPKNRLSKYIFSQIYELIGNTFKVYEEIIGLKTYGVSFQLYGVDIAINNELRPMIMEINKGPDLSAKDGRDKELKLNLSTDILKSIGLIENKDNNFITILELVNMKGKLIGINNNED